MIKNIINIFKLRKENTTLKDRMIRDINTLLEQQEEYYYKLVRVGNFWNNIYNEYESNLNTNKNLSLREKCPYSEFFCSVYSSIRTEYREIRSVSPYSVQMRENMDQKNSEYFFRSVSVKEKLNKVKSYLREI